MSELTVGQRVHIHRRWAEYRGVHFTIERIEGGLCTCLRENSEYEYRITVSDYDLIPCDCPEPKPTQEELDYIALKSAEILALLFADFSGLNLTPLHIIQDGKPEFILQLPNGQIVTTIKAEWREGGAE